MRYKIKLLKSHQLDSHPLLEKEVTVKGWVRTSRDQKNFSFIEINDGSTLSNLQVILDSSTPNFETLCAEITTGCSVSVTGILKQSPAKGQSVEVHARQMTIIGKCPAEDYPLQKKRHSLEFLRTIAHLRPRTNMLGAITRVRNALAFATHLFFQNNGFLYIHTPIITGADCEGAGEMFRVTTLKGHEFAKDENGSSDFFKRPTFLTVSGQLNAEIYACSLSDVYTFGPTFRAENSNTSRHLAEFWMIEPEMAFADLSDDMNCAQNYLKFLTTYLLENNQEDLALFENFVSKGLIDKLTAVSRSDFERVSYTDAIGLLQKSGKQFEYPVSWGLDLQSEHERFLTEEIFKKPVIVYNYPKEIKAFYMRLNEDNKTVAAMDVLVPGVGELIGGSQREERYDILEEKMKAHHLNPQDYSWYLDLRKYGTVPHAGFGLGFERLIQFCTGTENIRDVIPFPRYPGHADF